MLLHAFGMLFGSGKRSRRRKSSGASPPYETVTFGPLEAAIWLNRSKGGKASFRFTVAAVAKNGYRQRSLDPAHLVYLPGLVVTLGWWFATDESRAVHPDVRRALTKLDSLFAGFEFVKKGAVRQIRIALADDLEREKAAVKILGQHIAAKGRPANGTAKMQ